MRTRPALHLLIILALTLATGVFYIATMRDGHVWGDDFAMYIHHAKNVASGNAYGDTGYIYNPHYPDIGPRSYPPLFPLLLAPVYKIVGLHLATMKALNIFLFLVFLLLFYQLVREDLPLSYIISIVLVLVLNPYIWALKDQIVSEFLFLLVMCLTFHAAAAHSERDTLASAAATAFCIALCFATRTVGFIFLPCVLLYDLIRSKKLVPATLRTAGLALAFMAPQIIAFSGNGSTSSYADQLSALSLRATLHAVRMYAWIICRELWWNGYSSFPSVLLSAALGSLGLLGYLQRLRSRLSLLEIFMPAYAFLVVILWSRDQDLRLLIPLVPFWLFYAALGLLELGRFGGGAWERALAPVLLLLIFGSYAGAYSKTEYGPFTQSLGDTRFMELCEYIKKETARDSIFLFAKPRLLSLLTDRPASGYQDPLKQSELWDYCSEIGVNYIITSDSFDRDRLILKPFVVAYSDRIDEIYHNTEFQLYRVQPKSPLAANGIRFQSI